MGQFPETPPPGNMKRGQRMDRLQKRLMAQGLYVRPVCLDDQCTEWGYFIVSIDDPFEIKTNQEQDQG